MAINYSATRQKPLVAEPLDIDAALDYGVDFSEWLQPSETIVELQVQKTDEEGIAKLGDGVTPYNSRAGAVTPASPEIVSGQVAAWVYATQPVSAENVGKYFVLDFLIRTSAGRVDSRSLSIQLAIR